MAWKREKWLAEIFPGADQIYSAYAGHRGRELAIICGAVLDLALAELITLRLPDHNKEVEEFLGLDGDGMAPAGEFGARIRLALLLNILTNEDAQILRTIKDIRNQFAHTVAITFTTGSVIKQLRKLLTLMEGRIDRLANKGKVDRNDPNFAGLPEVSQFLDSLPEAGEGLVLAVFAVYQAYFHRLHGLIKPVGRSYDGPKHVAL